MRRIVALLLAPVAVVAAACGAGDPDAGNGAEKSPPPVSAADPDQLYEANATVLDDRTRGPMLCLGAVALSLPPQCGEVPITGWDWKTVDNEERAGGTTWGTYHVVGRYDGRTFAIMEVGPFEEAASDGTAEPDFASPCAEPPGGWTGLEHATQNDVGRVGAYADAQPEYVTSWVTHIDREKLEFGPVVFNVVFTGDAERHEAVMRDLWDGPLCVVARDVPSARELARIRRHAEADLAGLGLQMLWSQGPDVEPVIEIGVVADVGGKGQTAFAERYGSVVRLVPALEPAS